MYISLGIFYCLTVKDAARYLSRSENAIRILICRRTLNVYKLGRRVYLKRCEIDRLLERSTLLGGAYGT